MNATERLRALLDERGVEWTVCCKTTIDNQTYCCGHTFTEFQTGLIVTDLTPEQAIAATLGAGTCRMELPDLRGPAFTDVYICSECGGEVMVGTVMGESDVPKWCPWCGRKVVDE